MKEQNISTEKRECIEDKLKSNKQAKSQKTYEKK